MAVQQKQKKPHPRSTRLTVADWVLTVVHLILGGFLVPLIPYFLGSPTERLTDALLHVAVALTTLGYFGVSLTLLLRRRRAAVLLEILCTLGWWCGATFFWPFDTRFISPFVFIFPIGLFLIGVFHLLLASWLWRFRDDAEEVG
jgi:hypothetical protein